MSHRMLTFFGKIFRNELKQFLKLCHIVDSQRGKMDYYTFVPHANIERPNQLVHVSSHFMDFRILGRDGSRMIS